jgi:hypothetical protein
LQTTKENIVIVTAYPVNNLTAGQGNLNRIADGLISRGFTISLVCFSYPGHTIERPERFEEILFIRQERPQRFLYALLLVFFFPLFTVRFSFRALFFIRKRSRDAKLIFLDYSQVFIYALFLKKVRQKICMFAHDVIYQKYTRVFKNKWYGPMAMRYIQFTEKTMLHQSDNISVLSFKDKLLLNENYAINPVVSILKQRFTVAPLMNSKIDLNHFVFLGAWNRDENLDGLKWFIENVYPSLPQQFLFTIVGPGIKEAFKNNLPPAFKAVGFVDDLALVLQSSSALISPLFLGAGIKFKVLDAFKNGCRVIGTDISFEGIEIEASDILLKANAAEEFVKQIHYCSQTGYDPENIRDLLCQFINRFDDTLEWIIRKATS